MITATIALITILSFDLLSFKSISSFITASIILQLKIPQCGHIENDVSYATLGVYDYRMYYFVS